MSNITIITTADGSHSLLNTSLQETYHSVHGAIQESKHVFIRHGLEFFLTGNPTKRDVRILEIGFGTGLNALLTALYAGQTQIRVHYQSWEVFPLTEDIYGKLNYSAALDSGSMFFQLHEAAWNSEVAVTDTFTLEKKIGDVITDDMKSGSQFDIIFYDAFAPSKQPELWTPDVLKKVTDTLAPGGVWVTYCAKGQLRRDLKSLALRVESLPGPPGKREMLRATK
jgi:tRNA U34 5-methylaminomethyl-2-thiouridine-forming methyltransferase MnmC